MANKDLFNKLENIAVIVDNASSQAEILAEYSYNQDKNISGSMFLLQSVLKECSDNLYQIWDELRNGGGKWLGTLILCGEHVFTKRCIVQKHTLLV